MERNKAAEVRRKEGWAGRTVINELYDGKLWSKSCQSSAGSPLSGDGDLGGN